MSEYENRWVLPDQHSVVLWARARNRQGIKAVVDILEDYANDGLTASRCVSSYLDLIKILGKERMFASVSVKPSTLGFTHDKEACVQKMLALAKEASLRNVGFEIDMEGRNAVDFTLEAAMRIAESRRPVTVALQAYLDRTPSDLERMLSGGVRVRLVKGAYAGDTNDFADIQDRFKSLVRTLAESGKDFCIGTHDPELIVWATVKMQELPERIEFGMLKGFADKTKVDFVKNKWKVSEYVPYGENRAAYEERRRAYLRHLEAGGRSPAP